MKKITLISSAILALLVVSCQKENVAPTPNGNDANNLTNRIFKYNKEVKVYDRTNEHFVTVELQSDNDSIINNAFEYYNQVELVMLYDKPSALNTNDKTVTNILNTDSEPNTLSKNQDILCVKFNILNKGNSTGYKLIPKENLRYDTVYFTVSGSTAYFATCSWFYLYNQAGSSLKAWDYYLDGTWHLIQYKSNITQGTGWYFTGPYAYRMLEIRNSMFTTWCALSIYY